MRPNTLFRVAAVLALVFGVAFLLIPTTVLPGYGVVPEPAVTLLARFFGAALIQLGLVLYLLRDVRDAATVNALSLAGVMGSAAGLAVSLMGVLGGVVNTLGWSSVAIYALLLIGYGTCLRSRAVIA